MTGKIIRETRDTLPCKHNGTHMPFLVIWPAGLAEILSCKCTGESAANKADSGMVGAISQGATLHIGSDPSADSSGAIEKLGSLRIVLAIATSSDPDCLPLRGSMRGKNGVHRQRLMLWNPCHLGYCCAGRFTILTGSQNGGTLIPSYRSAYLQTRADMIPCWRVYEG